MVTRFATLLVLIGWTASAQVYTFTNNILALDPNAHPITVTDGYPFTYTLTARENGAPYNLSGLTVRQDWRDTNGTFLLSYTVTVVTATSGIVRVQATPTAPPFILNSRYEAKILALSGTNLIATLSHDYAFAAENIYQGEFGDFFQTYSTNTAALGIVSAASLTATVVGAGTFYGNGQYLSGVATGTPLYSVNLAPYATGTPLYVEADPVWVADSTGYLTRVLAASTYATGSPIYRLTASSLNFTNAGIESADFLALDLAPTGATAVGKIQWDTANGTPAVTMLGGNVTTPMGQQMVAYVRNAETSTLTKGTVVYLFSASGDRATVKRASYTGDSTSAKTYGVVLESIAANALGYIGTHGIANNIDTSAFSEGAELWLGLNGTLQTNRPVAPLHGVRIGVVEKSNVGAGQIALMIQNGYELNELHNVFINGVTNGDVLAYNSASNRWENYTLTAAGIATGTPLYSVTLTNYATLPDLIAVSNVADSALSTANIASTTSALAYAIAVVASNLAKSVEPIATNAARDVLQLGVVVSNDIANLVTVSNTLQSVNTNLLAGIALASNALYIVWTNQEALRIGADASLSNSVTSFNTTLTTNLTTVSNYFQTSFTSEAAARIGADAALTAALLSAQADYSNLVSSVNAATLDGYDGADFTLLTTFQSYQTNVMRRVFSYPTNGQIAGTLSGVAFTNAGGTNMIAFYYENARGSGTGGWVEVIGTLK